MNESTEKAATGVSARLIAAHVLQRVETDGAFAAAALDKELRSHPQMDSRDRALAAELVYGALRTKKVVLERLAAHAPRGLPRDDRVVPHLWVAAYQILLLDRIPAFAAVDAAVRAIKNARGPKVAGFANALLRKLAREGTRLDRAQAILDSAPRWLLEKLERDVGADEARALFGAISTDERERAAVRFVAGRAIPTWLASEPSGRASPVSKRVPRGGDLRQREGYAEGAFVLEEEGAQVVALALGAAPGERVLDACAGRGGKTLLLRERVGTGELWAADLYPEKLRELEREFERLRQERPRTAATDLSVGTGELPAAFDRILVDAPCTGTGTLAHRPEIALRLQPDDSKRLGQLSERIVRNASTLLRPGGRLVFAVCSVLADECEAVVERLRDVLEPTPFDATGLGAVIPSGATAFRLLPLAHGTDGFFVASFRRP